MRAASRIALIANQSDCPNFLDAPSHTTVQNNLLRIGLYVLQYLVAWQNDWVWIVDHSHTVGTTKCLAIVGIRVSEYRKLKRALEHEDLTVLDLLPVDQSNGEIVRNQLLGTCKK